MVPRGRVGRLKIGSSQHRGSNILFFSFHHHLLRLSCISSWCCIRDRGVANRRSKSFSFIIFLVFRHCYSTSMNMKRPSYFMASKRLTGNHRIPLLVYYVSAVVILVPSSSLASMEMGRASALNPSPLVSTGIKNLGNTCYMNAQLQCAWHIPLLRQLAMETEPVDPSSLGNKEDDESSNNTDDDVDVVVTTKTSTAKEESDAKIALRELFADMKLAASQHLPAVAPRSFCMRLGIPPMVQQDSQEFWKLLLPALEQESITDLYKGSFEGYITALDGSGRERRREELFLDLSLDVGKSSSLLDSLNESFGEPELLSVAEGNGWRPEKGADKIDAHKGSSLIVQGLPPILQFHLKRFTYDWQTDSMNKVNSRLIFPSELDLSTICKSANGEDTTELATTYDLQSIVIHMGKYGMGHYYAYVRPDICSDTWYRFNDDIVEKVSEAEVFEDAYGGAAARDDSSQKGKHGSVLGRLFRRFGGQGGNSYGYGGSTSNAYVVQYVRRSDRRKLYPE